MAWQVARSHKILHLSRLELWLMPRGPLSVALRGPLAAAVTLFNEQIGIAGRLVVLCLSGGAPF